MKKIVFAGIIFLALSVFTQAEAYDVADYFPLELNDSWIFTLPDMDINYNCNIIGTKVINGATTWIYDSVSGTAQDYYTLDSNGLRVHGGSIGSDLYKYNPPITVLPKNFSLGVTYTTSTTITLPNGSTKAAYVTVIAEKVESITSYYGALLTDTIKIKWMVSPNADMSGATTTYYWYNKNLGMVKMQSGSTSLYIKTATTWYASGLKKTELKRYADAGGYVYFEYMNENFNGTGYGRATKKRKANGNYDLFEYWGSTGIVKKLQQYDWSNQYLLSEDYNESGVITKRTTYYASGYKKQEVVFDPAGTWKNTIEYYNSAANLYHYQWLADRNASSGDKIYEQYDANGKLIFSYFDNGSYINTSYFASGNKKQDIFFGADGSWQKTTEYKDSVNIIRYKEWLADANPGLSGDPLYKEYDLNNRLVFTYNDDGSFVNTSYFISGYKKQDVLFSAGGAWKSTTEYWDNADAIMHYQWLADLNLSSPDDPIYKEYNSTGKLAFTYLDNGKYINTTYFASGNKKHDVLFASGGAWQMTTEYWDNTSAFMHYQWLADNNPSTGGDVIYQEYNSSGQLILKFYDDGTIWTSGSPSSLLLNSEETVARMDLINEQGSLSNLQGVKLVPELAGQSVNEELVKS